MMTIRTLPIEQLVPAEYNPRQLSAKAERKLKASLEEFGLVEPLVWNEATGRVVGGHVRLKLLRELGVAEVPVSLVHLSEAREKALNLVLNNREAQGQFDTAKLLALLEELEETAEFDFTGFEPSDVRNLKFEPAEMEPEAAAGDRVIVTIESDAAGFERFAAELDALVREYDLVSHIKWV